MVPPGQAEINGDKPVLIDNERIQGHHEYETGAEGEAELRRRRVISADPAKPRQTTEGTAENNVSPERAHSTPEAPEPPGTAGTGSQQNYTRSPALKNEPAPAGSPTEAENRENLPAPGGAERLTGHAAQEDEITLRRGQPTVHRAYDEATAILAGDSLLTLAFDILAGEETELPAERKAELVLALARMGVVSGRFLLRNFKYALLLIFIAAVIILGSALSFVSRT